MCVCVCVRFIEHSHPLIDPTYHRKQIARSWDLLPRRSCRAAGSLVIAMGWISLYRAHDFVVWD